MVRFWSSPPLRLTLRCGSIGSFAGGLGVGFGPFSLIGIQLRLGESRSFAPLRMTNFNKIFCALALPVKPAEGENNP